MRAGSSLYSCQGWNSLALPSHVPQPNYKEGTGQLSSLTEDWYTHPQMITLVHELSEGPPDLDPMSCAQANLTVKAITFYSAEMNGLLHPWYGRMLWNPPWGAGTRMPSRSVVSRSFSTPTAREM